MQSIADRWYRARTRGDLQVRPTKNNRFLWISGIRMLMFEYFSLPGLVSFSSKNAAAKKRHEQSAFWHLLRFTASPAGPQGMFNINLNQSIMLWYLV
jgi:hypothetical protein